jgi:hypothetical protein
MSFRQDFLQLHVKSTAIQFVTLSLALLAEVYVTVVVKCLRKFFLFANCMPGALGETVIGFAEVGKTHKLFTALAKNKRSLTHNT